MADRELAKEIVRRQMNQSGNILLSAIEPMPTATFYEEGVNGISVAWTLGHLACVMDLFCGWLDGEGMQHEPALHAMFNPLTLCESALSKAARVDQDWATKPKLILAFRTAQVRVLRALAAFDISRWGQPTGPELPDSLPLWGSVWESLGVHTYWHLGELAGCIPSFHGTYTLNTVQHYFFIPEDAASQTP